MHTLPIRILILSIATLLLLALGVYAFSLLASNNPAQQAQTPTLSDVIRNGTAPIPPLSTSTKNKLTKSNGFQALVSYTDNGFEPASITIKKGDTIRFTNNSSRGVWIAASGDLYPAARNGCGPSALDSCASFAPQDFWEFRFDVSGTWRFVNNLGKKNMGTVLVR